MYTSLDLGPCYGYISTELSIRIFEYNAYFVIASNQTWAKAQVQREHNGSNEKLNDNDSDR